ncbi:hypothetical protein DY102_03770 [Apilactobacillus timberlakei]|uniref:hypothetical protein n=1 Tax=Apilactobacillus timberlakei TaxID=2008380 RepID=UPI00112AC372|nr:hypothetical protein [Apilactobacillus timberlakei]TPR23169.1 hypothetical protein DY102_03770 [Apilactobacillus timberlakei]
MQKAIIEQNTYGYLKDHKFLTKIYNLGINNKFSLRKIFNKPHSNEYLKGYNKGISMFQK